MSTAAEPDPQSVAGTVFEERAASASRTYAEALINAASSQGQVDAVLDELDELIRDLWVGVPGLAAFLTSAGVRPEDKDRTLSRALEGKALPLTLQFLRVLNRHGRLDLLPGAARRAREIWDRRQNRLPVSVRSAAPMDEEQVAALRARLLGLTGGAEPILRLVVDPDLIGGLVVQVGDVVYDASVRTRIEQFRKHLMDARLREIQGRRGEFIQA